MRGELGYRAAVREVRQNGIALLQNCLTCSDILYYLLLHQQLQVGTLV